MNCAEATATAQAYVDGELDGVDREAVERHLVSCPGCSRRVHVQTRFRAAVRVHLHRPEVPFTLRRRIEESLGSQPIAPRRWPAWMSVPRIVPAAAAVFLIVAITGTVRRSNSMVRELAEGTYHNMQMPMDVTGSDCSSIASWFQGRLQFPVHAPALGGGATCQGGRLINVGQRSAAYLVYLSHGHRVTLLVFDPRDQPIESPERRVVNGREIYLDTGPGISTAAYRDRGLGYVVTADYDEDTLTQLVTTSFGR